MMGRALRPPFLFMDAVIVHFNTPELTTATIRSIWKHTPECKVTVFDNSDRRPFQKMDGVEIMDNTQGDLIDFDAFLRKYLQKVHTTINNWGSAKHCKTVDYLFDIFLDGFILVDPDVLLKQSIAALPDETKVFTGEVYQNLTNPLEMVPRVLPYLCWINVPLCREYGIRFFDGARSWKLYPGNVGTLYDTGASFFEDCANLRLRFKQIFLEDYIEHFQGGSYLVKNAAEWLEKNRELYE